MFSWWKELWHTATLEQATLTTGVLTLAGGLLAFLGVIITVLVTARHARRALVEDRKREVAGVKRAVLLDAAEVVVDVQQTILRSIPQLVSSNPDTKRLGKIALKNALSRFDLVATKLIVFDFTDTGRAVQKIASAVSSWTDAPSETDGLAIYDDIEDALNSIREAVKSLE